MEDDSVEVIVDVDRYPFKARLFDLWAGGYAINAMCVGRQGRSGSLISPNGLQIPLDRVNLVFTNSVIGKS